MRDSVAYVLALWLRSGSSLSCWSAEMGSRRRQAASGLIRSSETCSEASNRFALRTIGEAARGSSSVRSRDFAARTERRRQRRGRALAVQGFEATLKGVRSELDFDGNDSGEVAAATRDAARADRYLARGANRMRAAGRALSVQIGELKGH